MRMLPQPPPVCHLTERSGVVPGDPEASFLLAKLDGTFDCGLPMPLLTDLLPPDVIEGIRTWIAQGAPKN